MVIQICDGYTITWFSSNIACEYGFPRQRGSSTPYLSWTQSSVLLLTKAIFLRKKYSVLKRIFSTKVIEKKLSLKFIE